jgi:hypothetical protein
MTIADECERGGEFSPQRTQRTQRKKLRGTQILQSKKLFEKALKGR